VIPPSIALHDDGAVSSGAVLWRFRGRLRLTVVVKALFAVVPDGVATPAGPGAVLAKDRYRDGNPARSTEATHDLAPYLARCDVLFTGHAYAPGGRAPAGSVRLGLARDGRLLLDKTLHVFGDRAPAAPGGAPEPFTRIPIVYEKALGGLGELNPVGTEAPNLVDPTDARRAAGFGPISRYWPVRRRLLGKVDAKALEAPVAEIPEAMPWEYFQAAPSDQQIEHLHGGEWLVLDGLHPTLARVQTRLAAVRGAARVALQQPGAPAVEQAVDLACDTLAIDGDRQTFSLTWRGACEVPEGEAAPASLAILAALEVPGVPVDWARLLATAPHPSAGPPPPPAMLQSTSVTFDVPSGPALPFAKDATTASVLSRLAASPSAAAPPKRSHATVAMSLDQLVPPPEAALPFAPTEAPVTAPSRPPPAAEEVPGAPWSSIPPAMVQPPVEGDADTAEMPPIDPRLLPPVPVRPPEALPAPAPLPVIAAPRAVPPPADPWAQAPTPLPEPEPQKRTQAPPAFERPAAAAVKGSFYAKFKK
jgi:hypothetical protein